VRKRLKTTGNSAKKFRRSALILVILATTSLAIGAAVTVISRQNVNATSQNQEQNKALASRDANRSYVTVKVAGQDVQVDSQTGQLKELTPEETKKLAAGLKQEINQTTNGLVEVEQPDGSVTMELNGHFQNVTVAKRNDDGTLSESCVDNPRAAGEFFGIDPQLIENPDGTQATKPRTHIAPAKNQNQ